MRSLALTAAALHLVLCVVAAFLMIFIATFPFENQVAERATADDWLVGAASVIVVLAIAIGGAVTARRAGLAAVASVAQLAVGAVVVAYALRVSDHSDGSLLLFAVAFAATAASAAGAMHAEKR